MRRLYLLIAACVVILDHITKWVVLARFSPETTVTVIPGFFDLVLIENRGIAFGFFGGLSSKTALILIIAVSLVAIAIVSVLLWKNEPAARLTGCALALILGGALGNLVDRVFRGSVVDFLDFYVRGYHWPAFNVADSAIVIGAGLLVVDLFWGEQLEGTGNREQGTDEGT